MDWSPTEMQQAVDELAGQILQDDPKGWDALVEAELLSLADLLDVSALLVQVGRSGAHLPVFETVALGWPIWQSEDPPPAGTVVTGSLVDPLGRDPRRSSTKAVQGRLTGNRVCVPAVDRASLMVVPADDGVYGVELADCAVTHQIATNGDVLGEVVLDGTPGRRLGGLDLLDPWLVRVHLGVSALQLGLCRQALAMTASYVSQREQFGRPIGTFQAVSQRAADAWIDVELMDATLLQAAWRAQSGLPVERELLIARYWASEGSHRVLAAAQHLHGGFGFDRDYPLHRYFLTSKLWEFLLGGAGQRVQELGDLLASRVA